MVTLQSGTFSKDPATGAVVFKPNITMSKTAVTPQVIARQQPAQEAQVYSEATAKKPFTSAGLSQNLYSEATAKKPITSDSLARIVLVEGKPVKYIPKAEVTETIRPSDIDLAIMGSPIGATPVGAALIQISDFYLGGKSIQKTTERAGIPVSESVVGTPVVTTREIPGGTETTTITPVTTTTKTQAERTVASKPIESGFATLQKDISERMYSGIASLAGTSPEAVKTGIRLQSLVSEEMANKAPTLLNIQSAMGTSEIRSTLDKPLEAGLYFGAGAGLGIATKGAGVALKRSQMIAEPILESESARSIAPRLASTMGTQIVEKGPKLLTALYGADVASRVTEGGKNLGLGSIAAKAAPIATQEVLPLGAGFGAVERAGTLAKEAKAGYSGYKAMLSERAATTPILTLTPTEGKLAIGQIVPERPTIGGYVKYEAQKSVPMSVYDTLDYIRSGKGLTRGIGNIPARVGIAADVARGTILETAPEYLYRGIEGVKGGVGTGASRFGKAMGIGRTPSPEITRPFVDEETAVTLGRYTRSIEKPIVPEYQRPFVDEETAMILGRYTKTETPRFIKNIDAILSQKPDIAVKAMIQESGYSIGWEGAPRYTYTLKQAKPQFIAIGDIGDFKPSGGSIKPSVGGTGIRVETKPSFERITTKTVGGAKVSGLVAERPVRSIESLGETTLGKARSIGQSADYRGKPLSSTMKPMGKQATGIAIMSEEISGLAKPIARTTEAPRTSTILAPLSLRTDQRPSYSEVSELTRIRTISPSFVSITGISRPSQRQQQVPISEVSEKAKSRSIVAEAAVLQSPRIGFDIQPSVRSGTESELKPKITTRLTEDTIFRRKQTPYTEITPDVIRREAIDTQSREDVRTRFDIITGTRMDTTQRITQRTEPRLERNLAYEFKTYTGQGLGSFYGIGGGGGEGGRRRGRYAFRETLSIRGLLGIGKSLSSEKSKPTVASEYYKRGRIGKKITFEKVKPSPENVERLYTRSGGQRKITFRKVRSITTSSIW